MAVLYYEQENELYHHGIKGQKWGVRRFQNSNGSYTEAGKKRRTGYRSTSLTALKARHDNNKIDKSFQEWDENTQKRERAVASGKAKNQAFMDYRMDPSNKDLKKAYKQANREYKHDLRQNTTYRKGVIRGEVGQDASRKYLKQAKAVEKQLLEDPTNKELKKQYRYYMNQHDVARAKARKAPAVGERRSRKIASIKAMRTKAVKSALVAEGAIAGAYAVNRYMVKNGKQPLSAEQFANLIKNGKAVMDLGKFIF